MRLLKVVSALVISAMPAWANEVSIAPDVPWVEVQTEEGAVEIQRVQDTSNVIGGDWARTSRPCPNFCVQPMVPAPGVTPIGELEILEMLQDPEAIVVDSRVVPNYESGAIPGAINIPYTEAADRLDELGCEIDFDGFICDEAKKVALYCNGNWCGQSPTAARRMIAAGFPAEKLFYYRGGMQAWRLLGLTVTE
ncbi:rhodanese-like domain-containing protein [Shimia sp. CNT1-13L.2]|uniref:rhodanese-like domain-containing protein n=1 Tax=Shimia sp. CNT1-13L.2 TaxID=2959663 RepID=UPI0020CB8DC5|nr:rhodanese-like domain-containing protein [Shimia sp. CNT1-13L.2]MCP9480340.1 rhodanese-like domain-containing protein [Shimia sp. CNT1-13L.2]